MTEDIVAVRGKGEIEGVREKVNNSADEWLNMETYFRISAAFKWARHSNSFYFHVWPVKTQISLCIYAVWSESSLATYIL